MPKLFIDGTVYNCYRAYQAGPCTNCDRSIEKGDLFIYKWGGRCHARGCSRLLRDGTAPVTSSDTLLQAPPNRDSWKYAPDYGTCVLCCEEIQPGQPIYETPQPHHTRCRLSASPVNPHPTIRRHTSQKR